MDDRATTLSVSERGPRHLKRERDTKEKRKKNVKQLEVKKKREKRYDVVLETARETVDGLGRVSVEMQ